jgi:protein PhnA
MGSLLVCPECAHEWAPNAVSADEASDGAPVIKVAVGAVLADGDTVTIIKNLKFRGSPTSIMVGTKVRGIKLVHGSGVHDIDCNVDGFGSMMLKSGVVKRT